MEEWQHKREKYLALSEELIRAYDREIMCLERVKAACQRAIRQDIVSFYLEIFQAIFFGGNWPWAEVQMWKTYVKRAQRTVQSVQKEQEALGFIPLDLDNPASLEACYGPLVADQNPPGTEITFQTDTGHVKKALVLWVFKDNNGEVLYLISQSQPVEET